MSFRNTSNPDFEIICNGEYVTFLLNYLTVSYLHLKKNKSTFKQGLNFRLWNKLFHCFPSFWRKGFLLICFFIVCFGRTEPTCCYKWNASWEILPTPTQSLFSQRKWCCAGTCEGLVCTPLIPHPRQRQVRGQILPTKDLEYLLRLSSGKKHHELPLSTLLTKGTEACGIQRSDTPLHHQYPQGFGEKHCCIKVSVSRHITEVGKGACVI